jgi:GAF domain-containing protein
MHADPAVGLAETFGEIARTLLVEPDVDATLDRIVQLAVETIEHCEHAGISMVGGRRVLSPASSDDVPATVDRLQSETGEGPCLDAIREHEVFQTGCLSQETRWPDFARRANAESGIESILSFRLFIAGNTLGALNLYSTQVDAFHGHDFDIGTVFAAHAAVALSTSRQVQNLETAISSRQLIGEATGLLMAREEVSSEEAFDILKRASQRLNVKLRLVAERVVHPEDHDDSE